MLRRHPLFQEILARGERSGATIFWKHRDLTALPIHPVTVSLALRVGQIDGDNPHSYITHSGLLRLASRRRCVGIQVEMVRDFCEPTGARWAIRATGFPFDKSAGFVGFGDPDPSNVSLLVRGAEMRVAETRAVNRALRKALWYGHLLGRGVLINRMRGGKPSFCFLRTELRSPNN